MLDPNSLSEDGTVALSVTSVSKDAKFLAYGLSTSGSDWVTIKVLRVEDKNVEPDSLLWVSYAFRLGTLKAFFFPFFFYLTIEFEILRLVWMH